MGDRGNIKVVQDGHTIYFYTHWRGSLLPKIVREALLKGRPRWGDPPYLNRVLFQTLLGKDDGITGFGIAGYQCDNENTIVTIDHNAKTVKIDGVAASTFEEFTKMGEAVSG